MKQIKPKIILFEMKNIVLKALVFLIFIAFGFFFTNCGQTDADLEQQEKMIGNWKPVNSQGDDIPEIPKYVFLENNRGVSIYEPFNSTDSFGWEVRRNQLKIYYDKAPGYYIGYDNYNTRSLFKIKEFTDTAMYVIQFFSTGYQKEYYLKRFQPIFDNDDFKKIICCKKHNKIDLSKLSLL
jgi:hypothetical protein